MREILEWIFVQEDWKFISASENMLESLICSNSGADLYSYTQDIPVCGSQAAVHNWLYSLNYPLASGFALLSPSYDLTPGSGSGEEEEKVDPATMKSAQRQFQLFMYLFILDLVLMRFFKALCS